MLNSVEALPVDLFVKKESPNDSSGNSVHTSAAASESQAAVEAPVCMENTKKSVSTAGSKPAGSKPAAEQTCPVSIHISSAWLTNSAFKDRFGRSLVVVTESNGRRWVRKLAKGLQTDRVIKSK
jgi:hypothetical protein